MFDLERAISGWRQQLSAGGFKNRENLSELENHLRDEIEQLVTTGQTAERAFEIAVEHIGAASLLRNEFSKLGIGHSGFIAGLKRFFTNLAGAENTAPSDFTTTGQQVLEFARKEAPRLNHDFIGTEHVLLGLLKSQSDVLPTVMRRMGVTGDAVRDEIEKWVGVGIPAKRFPMAIRYTPRALKALALAAREAKALRQSQVGPEHVFLGLIREGHGVAALVLRNLGVNVKRTRDEILREINARKSMG